jgi:hypothetical protein
VEMLDGLTHARYVCGVEVVHGSLGRKGINLLRIEDTRRNGAQEMVRCGFMQRNEEQSDGTPTPSKMNADVVGCLRVLVGTRGGSARSARSAAATRRFVWWRVLSAPCLLSAASPLAAELPSFWSGKGAVRAGVVQELRDAERSSSCRCAGPRLTPNHHRVNPRRVSVSSQTGCVLQC